MYLGNISKESAKVFVKEGKERWQTITLAPLELTS